MILYENFLNGIYLEGCRIFSTIICVEIVSVSVQFQCFILQDFLLIYWPQIGTRFNVLLRRNISSKYFHTVRPG